MDEQLNRLRRKRDQEWELAGCARQDGDVKDEALHIAKAQDYAKQISAHLKMDD